MWESFRRFCNDITSKSTTELFLGGATSAALKYEGVFIIVAMLGIYLSMAGNRKWGNRLSSGSIVLYTILRVVAR